MEYNKAQEEAIRIHEGQLLLISCPGSGKTTTMLRRIADMVESGIDPSGILMVTFTEAAAREMRERYQRDYGYSSVNFATLHSLAFRILRENGYADSKVLPAELQRRHAAELIRKFSKNPYDTSVKDLLLNISAFKNKDIPMEKFECSKLDKEDLKKILPLYEARKKADGYIDFDDMILHCRKLLAEHPEICARYQELFPYLICDEYQDTNRIQKDILYLLAGKNGNLCVVGDDDQSIYGFRGAESRIMLDFKKDFPKAHSIYMSTNYRSLPEIVESSRRLIEHNSIRFKKDIQASRKGEAVLEVLSVDGRDMQFAKLFDKMKELREAGHSLKDAAVLTRTNAQLEDLTAYFEEHGIPYLAGESIRDPYEHFIFRDILCYLRLINGNRQKEDLMRVINRPNHYVKLQALAELESWTDADLMRLMSAQYSSAPWIVNGFRDYLKELSALKGKNLNEQLRGILEKLNYRSYLKDYAESSGTDLPSLEAKFSFFLQESAHFSDLQSWYQAAQNHVQRHREIIARREQEGIRLCTMHQAKGLEWDTVFILDCVMGITPSPLSRSFSEREEERRLFYVAVTRARDRLYLLKYTENQVQPSLFLKEMGIKKSFFQEGSSSNFQIGFLVHHVKFGEGRVVELSASTVTVDFAGTRRIFKR